MMGTPTLLQITAYLALVAACGCAEDSSHPEGTDMSLYPSLSEHSGWYNINEADRKRLEDESVRFPIFRTADRLPRFTWEEFWETRKAMERFLETHGQFPGLPKDRMHEYYRYCTHDEWRDRTLAVEIPNYDIITVEFLKAAQREVLSSRPLWRILIAGENEETVIIVYPQCIRMENEDTGKDIRENLARIVSEVQRLRSDRTGPQDRQVELVREKLRFGRMTKIAQRDGYAIVAAIDNYYGDREQTSIWILHCGGLPSDVTIEYPPSTGISDRFTVDANGNLEPAYYLDLDDPDPPFWLQQWVLVNADVAEKGFTIQSRIEKCLRSFDFSSLQIIRDDDLRKQ